MLFNSPEFLLIFLLAVLLGYYVLWRWRSALAFLVLVSLVFYAWWELRYLALILVQLHLLVRGFAATREARRGCFGEAA